MERRTKQRFNLKLKLKYCVGSSDRSKVGQLIDISSSGALFSAEDSLAERTIVRMWIDWPILLNGRIPLSLYCVARVNRMDGSRIAVYFTHRDFRIRRRGVGGIQTIASNLTIVPEVANDQETGT